VSSLAGGIVVQVSLLIHVRHMRAEREHAARGERWRRQFLSSWPELFFETDAQGNLVAISDSCVRLLGVTVDSLLGRPLTEVLLARRDQLPVDLPEQMLPWRKADGTEFLLATRLLSLSPREPSAVIGTATDASGLERARAAQFYAESRVAAIVEAMPNGVMLVSRNNDRHEGNERFADFFGLSVEELVQKPVDEILPAEAFSELSMLLGGSLLGLAGHSTIQLVVMVADRERALELAMVPYYIEGELGGVLIEAVDVTDRAQHAEELRHMAEYDQLTGLPNRFNAEQTIAKRIERARAVDALLGVMLIDIDRFKVINDTLGHHMGDLLLRQVAERLVQALPENHVVARFGGDEFVVVTGQMEDAAAAAHAAAAICRSLGQTFEIDGHEVQVGASIGVSLYPNDGLDSPTLLRRSDSSMYRAKELGGGGYQFSNYATDAALDGRLALERDLRQAVENDGFVLYYMPEMDTHTGQIRAMEALIRWENHDRGLIPPSGFIPLLEELNLIDRVGEWALEAACQQALRWNGLGKGEIRVAVNLSPQQLRKTDLAELVKGVLERTGLPPHLLELEVTETATLRSPEQAFLTLGELRRLGVHIALDDFGTGHSSLTRLRQLPIDTVKVDRSFVQDLLRDADAHAIVNGVIALGHAMDLRVVAEGVETAAQLRALEAMGCDLGQGFFLSHPLPGEACLAVIREQGIDETVSPPAKRAIVASADRNGKGDGSPIRIAAV
jgi:diguanylate cyclase (GGDEF)-like protein/PAS domain S-box-containing protein